MRIVLRNRILPLIALVMLVGLDRLFKRLAELHLYADNIRRSVNLWSIGDTRILNLTYVENSGAAFGIMQGYRLLLTLIPGLFMLGVLIFMLSDRVKGKLMLWSLVLVVSGGIGNLIDRVFQGYVIDYIDFTIINFPVFNLADICIVTGTFLLAFAFFRDEYKAAKQKKLENNIESNNDSNQTDS